MLPAHRMWLLSAGSKAATGASFCRTSHTRTAPSRPQVTSSGGPKPAACSAAHHHASADEVMCSTGVCVWFWEATRLVWNRCPAVWQAPAGHLVWWVVALERKVASGDINMQTTRLLPLLRSMTESCPTQTFA
jgi:hypothetical protein